MRKALRETLSGLETGDKIDPHTRDHDYQLHFIVHKTNLRMVAAEGLEPRISGHVHLTYRKLSGRRFRLDVAEDGLTLMHVPDDRPEQDFGPVSDIDVVGRVSPRMLMQLSTPEEFGLSPRPDGDDRYESLAEKARGDAV